MPPFLFLLLPSWIFILVFLTTKNSDSMKKHLLALALVLLACVATWAQRVVTGKVTDKQGEALIGASILAKGTNSGTVTDLDGSFSLNVPGNASTLVISYTGYNTQEMALGASNVIDVQMDAGITLEETVVTALGVKRATKALPYAAQQVNEEQLNVIRQTSLNNALAGKVAGVQVRSQASMALDRDAGIRIRGVGSLTDGGPLYVIDGTPINNNVSTNVVGGNAVRPPVNGAIDVNPDDIESINILKGPAATAIYGQRGDRGVVLITTKKGTNRKGVGIEVNQSNFLDRVYILPSYQNQYAGGAEPDLLQFKWQTGMPNEWKSLDGKFYHDYSDDSSWGPKMEGQEYIPWYAWYPGTQYTGKTTALVGSPDNIRKYYDTGVTSMTNVNLSTAKEGYNLRVSLSNQNVKGLLPTSGQDKYTVATTGSFDLGKKFTLGTNITYVTSKTTGQFDDNYGNQSTGSFNSWFHRNIDMDILRELRGLTSPEGYLASWNHNNPGDYLKADGARQFYAGNYWYNFYSFFDNISHVTNRQRLMGDINLTYKLNDHFRVSGFLRRNENQSNYENRDFYVLEQSGTQTGHFNSYATGLSTYTEDNYEGLATYSNNFGQISFEANAGANIRIDRFKRADGATSNGLNVPDLFRVDNSKVQVSPSEFRSLKEVRSLYARGSFGFKDMLYLDWSARNDWSSALPADNNSYFYPSIGTSFVFSELTRKSLPFLSFGKIRGSWAQVGSDLDPYRLGLNYPIGANQWNGNFTMNTPDQITAPNIQPSLSSAYEFGLDLKFFKSRLGFSATYFNESKVNEILAIPVSSASGFTSQLVNAGQIDRRGIELQLDAKPIAGKNLSWDVSLNFSSIDNEVVELTEGITAQQVAASTFSTRTGVVQMNVVGEKWGQLRGGAIKRDAQGRPIVGADGLFTAVPNTYLGSVLPNFFGGMFSSLNYKNLVFNFSLDFSQGGKYFSLSDSWGVFSGIFERTAATNDKGKNVRDDVADGGGVRVDGVNAAGEAVTVYVPSQSYYQQFYNRRISEPFIYDLTFVKLRELSLGYNIPVKKMGLNKYIQRATVSLTARNPWLIYAKNRDFDPSELKESYGENGQFPGTRSIGFNVKLGF
jgi:TonB-linked SusC/RagA family outer membrane protein